MTKLNRLINAADQSRSDSMSFVIVGVAIGVAFSLGLVIGAIIAMGG